MSKDDKAFNPLSEARGSFVIPKEWSLTVRPMRDGEYFMVILYPYHLVLGCWTRAEFQHATDQMIRDCFIQGLTVNLPALVKGGRDGKH